MFKLNLEIKQNKNSYKIDAIISKEDYELLIKYKPVLLIPNLLNPKASSVIDVQNISLSLFDIEEVSSNTEEYQKDPNKILKRLIKKAKIDEENEVILPPETPEEEGYYLATLYNFLNPFNERFERIYFSNKLGWMADENNELSYSFSIKNWQK